MNLSKMSTYTYLLLYKLNRAYIKLVLYTNIDLKLRNKSHGPMLSKIGVTCVYNGHKIYNTTI